MYLTIKLLAKVNKMPNICWNTSYSYETLEYVNLILDFF